MSGFVRRYASAGVRDGPLPDGLDFVGPLDWQRLDDRRWRVTLPLPPLADDSILVPSLSLADAEQARFQFSLRADDGRWPLQPIPSAEAPPAATDERIRCAVDCWELVTATAGLELLLEVDGLVTLPPHWLSVSARQRELADIPLPDGRSRVAARPPARSQRLASPALAPRVCSPTCMTMLLDRFAVAGAGTDGLWQTVMAECHDPGTRLYGVWPRALRAAATRGVLGAVEVFDDWRTVCGFLDADLPVVLSIRFEADALPGSPQRSSGGHLLVLYGIRDDQALVMDPAAHSLEEVPRSYPLEALAAAWLRHRGAAYILLP